MTNKLTVMKAGGILVFFVAVILLVLSFSGRITVAVAPTDAAHADGGAAASKNAPHASTASGIEQHISGLFFPDTQDTQAPNATPATGANSVNNQTSQTFGAVASPDIPSPWLRWGGLGPIWNGDEAPVATSSTFCSIQSPAATSTINFASFASGGLGNLPTGLIFDISTSTTPYATSTQNLIAGASLSSTTAVTWELSSVASSSLATVLSNKSVDGELSQATVPPNTYVNFRIGTTSAGTFPSYLSGNCQVQFIQL